MAEQPTQERLLQAFDAQLVYTATGRPAVDGSMAIALGRTVGLAAQLGLNETAAFYWEQLAALEPKVPGAPEMPRLEDLRTGYEANKASDRFDRFADGAVYTATPGLAFSNSMGSLAFMLDYLRRRDVAIVNGGEPVHIMDGGTAALRAMGFEKLAGRFDEMGQKIIAEQQGLHK